MTDPYEEAYRESLENPEAFWGRAAEDLVWHKRWDRVLDDSNAPFYRWFAGAECNTCYNAVDRHVAEGRANQAAIIHDSPVTGKKRTLTYHDLQNEVAAFAGALRAQGVDKGDRVIIYMPMIPESLVAMLACARLGAIHSVVFGGFAAHELATRIDDAKPKAIVCASCGIEPGRTVAYKPLVDSAIDEATHKPDATVVLQRDELEAEMSRKGDVDWQDVVKKATPADCVPVKAEDPLYILYTSGTTGQPKGIVRDNGGHMVALKWSMKAVYNIEPGDVYWAASDVGWVVGHSYIVYGPLLHGCTTIVFEGKPVGTPDAGVFWRVISEHKVRALFTAPTAFRAIKRADPDADLMAGYDLSRFEALFLAGERSDPDTVQWAEKALNRPVIDHWWQTETGWAIAANPLGLHRFPVKYGSATKPMPGWNLQVLDDNHNQVKPGDIGDLVSKLPLPPGSLSTLWNADERFKNSYLADFPGYYRTGDAGYIDDDGYVFVMTRTDDIINVAGHRLSTGAMEGVLANHSDVAECAVIGVGDDIKGQVPLGLLCLRAGAEKDTETIANECVAMIRDQIGPVAAFKTCAVVDRLPKTRSGKTLRGAMQKIADNEDFKMPATIDDPTILDEIREALERVGYGRARKG